jgi:hypothetical protein
MVAGGIGGADFAMTRRAEYRGVEFAVRAYGPGKWEWAYYPKHAGKTAKGEVRGMRREAIKECEKAIDAFLAVNSN